MIFRPPLAILLVYVTSIPISWAQESSLTSGRNLAAACASCHPASGARQEEIPALAGRQKDFLVRRMLEFKSGDRPATVMQQIARGYTDGQIETLSIYLATQKAD
jgi:cytochrome subunit of sulfide dehydrogenase